MGENVVRWFQGVIRKKVDLRHLTAICVGDQILACRIAVIRTQEVGGRLRRRKVSLLFLIVKKINPITIGMRPGNIFLFIKANII